jgi:hypothetical protein
VGRFGGRAGQREATASGVVAATLAWLLAMTQGRASEILVWALLLVIVALLGAGGAYLGGRRGLKRRKPAVP